LSLRSEPIRGHVEALGRLDQGCVDLVSDGFAIGLLVHHAMRMRSTMARLRIFLKLESARS